MSQRSMCEGEEHVPQGVRQIIRKELVPDEHLVWIGQPIPSVMMMQYFLYFIVGGAVLLAGIYFYMGEVTMPVPIVFILLGLFGIAVPIFHFVVATQTGYALTSKRTLVVKQGLLGVERQSYKPSELVFMKLEDLPARSGAGNLIFHTVMNVSTSQDQAGNLSTTESTKKYGFIAIDSVYEIERLVRDTLLN